MKERIIGTTVSCRTISLDSVTFVLPRAGGDGVTDLTMNTLKKFVSFQVSNSNKKKKVDHYSFELKMINLYT